MKMYAVGMPVMKLDRQSHFNNKSSRSGNAMAVACEAMEERRSADPDLDRSKTDDNLYMTETDMTSGEKLVHYWEEQADAYRVKGKDGKERKLRSDAGIGMAGIVKPEKAFMDSLTAEQQLQFMEDSGEVIKAIYEKRGIVIDAMVIHFDEGNPHIHYFGHDPEYKLGKKLGLPLYDALNRSEYPKAMRAKGWPIRGLEGFQEAVKGMNETEREEYKQKRRKARRESRGKSSADYKREKDLKQKEADLAAREAALDLREQKLQVLVQAGRAATAEQVSSDVRQEKKQSERALPDISDVHF